MFRIRLYRGLLPVPRGPYERCFFIVTGMPRILEMIFSMQYDDAGLIQAAPGRSMPGEIFNMKESPCVAPVDRDGCGQRLRSCAYTRVSGFNP